MDEIYDHIRDFEGLEVRGYDPRTGGLGDLKTTCPRLFTVVPLKEGNTAHDLHPPLSIARKGAMFAVALLTIVGVVLWSGWALLIGFLAVTVLASQPTLRLTAPELNEMWASLLQEPNLGEVKALVIGPWFIDIDEGPANMVQRLAELAPRLPALRAIFLGDIMSEECEISWIEQGDLTPLLDAFPELETLVVRGANGLRFEALSHPSLRKLTIQSGGLGSEPIEDLVSADLPALEHLELWLGEENYGFDGTVTDVAQVWAPTTFPRLDTLALRNSMITDEIAATLATSPGSVSRLHTLDLSLGTLSDLGAQALFNNPDVLQLERLDLRRHYLSDDWIEKLQTMPIDVDISEPQGWVDPEDDEDLRYVAISE